MSGDGRMLCCVVWLRWAALLLLGVVGESWPVVTLGHAKWLGIRSGRAATRGDLVSFGQAVSLVE